MQTGTLQFISWVNTLYMNQKQWGIQTSHCVSDMSLAEYGKDMYKEWATNHKTILMFDGTRCLNLRQTYSVVLFIQKVVKLRYGVELPGLAFHEDYDSLEGAITATAIIFPLEERERVAAQDKLDFGKPQYVSLKDIHEEAMRFDAESVAYRVAKDFRGSASEFEDAPAPPFNDETLDAYIVMISRWLNAQKFAL